jgi:acyl-CoA thioester hydrolase
MTEALSSHRHAQVRVRYADTDQMGVAYHANYLVWFEVSRTEWMRAGGWSYREAEREGLALPVLEAHCEYRAPARYDDELDIAARASQATPVRLRFDYEIRRNQDQLLLAQGHTVHAAVDRSGRPRRLPAQLRALIK